MSSAERKISVPPSKCVSNPFDYNLPALWKKNSKCAVCSNEFLINAKEKYNRRRPLLMRCAHSVCDRCCFTNRPNASLTCSICSTSTKIERGLAVREIFETNYYLMGMLTYKDYNLNYDLSIVDHNKPIEKKSVAQQDCYECNEVQTNMFCIQCTQPYCKDCFEKVHSGGKIFKKHCLSKLDRRTSVTPKHEQKKCRQHNSFIFKYCCDCKVGICPVCSNEYHSGHKVSSLLDENNKSMMKINCLIEAAKSAREANKQAQKDAKFIEKRYEQYATNTIDEISNYFIYLHGVLQNIERKALFEVKDHTMNLLTKSNQTQATLKNGLDSLEDLLSTLQNTANNPPANYSIAHLIERANNLLETVPSTIEFASANDNPFEFIELKKRPVIFPNLFELKIDRKDFMPKIRTYFGDVSVIEQNQSEQSSINAIPKKTKKNNKNNKNQKLDKTIVNDLKLKNSESLSIETPARTQLNLSNSSRDSVNLMKLTTSQRVHVSHIKSPHHFYIQIQQFLAKQDEFQQFIASEADYAGWPDYIETGEIYFVLNPSNKIWYRGRVIDSPVSDVYKMFLVDYGNSIDVPKQQLRIISDSLKAKPLGAIKCSLYGVAPKKDEWNDKARQLMSEIIMNESVHMIIMKQDEILQVDLITSHLYYPVSVRQALIFADVAEVDDGLPNDICQKVQSLQYVMKTLLTGPTDRFYKNVFKDGESFRGVILNINDPHHFYSIKYEHKCVIDNLYEKLNTEYQLQQQKIYTPQVYYPCAVCIEGDWYRAKITEVFPKNKCTVWLVDKAKLETVCASQLRVLLSKYISVNECTFQCSLIDIEPLQKNNYSWTTESIDEFKRIARNPVLHIFIHRSKNFRYKIGVHICKKEVDINVNSLLVKYKHANSTGPESLCVEYPKTKDLLQNTDDDLLNEISALEISTKSKAKTSSKIRSKVKVCYIVSPGEFYVHKIEHQSGISKLHDVIQIAAEKEEDAPTESGDDSKDENLTAWKVGDNCLVRLKFKEESVLQWYRATISVTDNSNEDDIKYSVFLRDYGQTFANISGSDIKRIPNLYDRVCNGAIKCHLACIQPTGGLKIWSGASIDEFKSAVDKFEELAGSIQGNRNNDSIAIVLWGLTRDCSGPLEPTICKWININKTLVNIGLVHLVEQFTPLTDENVMQNDAESGQESFNEWLRKLNYSIDKSLRTDKIKILRRELSDELEEPETDEGNDDGESLTAWLPAAIITKKNFLGVPTCVDNEFIIYLHDVSQNRLLDNMRTIINQKAASFRKGMVDSFWYTGQPCVARYHLDKLFYRAIVLETKQDRVVRVQFIDYGNIEDCYTKELRKDIVLQEIPIQATKFKLDRIVPLDGSKFSIDAIDFVHSQIVGKICKIRISPDQFDEQVTLCSIECESCDVAEMMIKEGFGKAPGRNLISPSLESCYSPSKLVPISPDLDVQIGEIKSDDSEDNDIDDDDDDDDLKVIEEVVENPGTSKSEKLNYSKILDSEDYQEIFYQLEMENFCDSLHRVTSDEDSENDLDGVANTYKPSYCGDPLKKNIDNVDREETTCLLSENTTNEDISPLSFDPNDASTVKSAAVIRQTFANLHLSDDVTGFKCELTYLKDATNLLVYPLIREHKNKIVEMSKFIQSAAKTSANLKTYEAGTPCLAIYDDDKMWYRAVIRSYKEGEKRAEVVFVDFLNNEMVQCKRIRCCPPKVLNIPLRNVQIKLANVKPNPRFRDVDINTQLVQIIGERKFYAKIVKHGDIPEVELYENSDADVLLYEKMMADRFYILTNN